MSKLIVDNKTTDLSDSDCLRYTIRAIADRVNKDCQSMIFYERNTRVRVEFIKNKHSRRFIVSQVI